MTRAALAVLLIAACGGGQSESKGSGSSAPVYLEMTSLAGDPVRLRDMRGQPVVLHLFTVGSMSAQMDVLQLNDAHDAGKVKVLGVALDPHAETLIRAWAENAGPKYQVVIGSEDITMGKTDLGAVFAVPTTIVLNSEGVVRFRVDRQLQPGELERALR